MGSLGRRSWKCRPPSLSLMRSIRRGKGSLAGSSGLGSLGGSLNSWVRLSVPSLANSTSVVDLSNSTSARCRAPDQRLSSSRLA
ncbi:hypothetical protein D3C78_899160 [compost metagenome]